MKHIPGVVRVLGLERVNRKLALVMEDFGARSLASFLKERRFFPSPTPCSGYTCFVGPLAPIGAMVGPLLAEVRPPGQTDLG